MINNERGSGLRYMIIGTGGTGGAIGAHLAHSGSDVTFIARGRQLEAMRHGGLMLHRPDDEFVIYPVKAWSMEEYDGDAPDVIFVCVKGYSVDSTIPFIERVAGPDTLVIPILNVFGTGGRMQGMLPDTTVLDGCIYIWTELREPGLIWMSGTIFRVVYGLRRDQKSQPGLQDRLSARLEEVKRDLDASGISGEISDNIERDALRKFSFVSPQGACGLYFNTTVGGFQQPGEPRDFFVGLIREISDLADAMGIGFGEDIVPNNLAITDGSDPGITTSMQKDVAAGRATEVDGLVYEVVRLGEQYGVDVPHYTLVADELRRRGL